MGSVTVPTARLAVYLVLRRDREVLLGLRRGTGYEDGRWGLPSGKVEADESFEAAVLREAREEVGVIVAPGDLRLVHLLHRRVPEGLWVDAFFETRRWEGRERNLEPAKCGALGWFPIDALPADAVPYVADALAALAVGRGHGERGFDRPPVRLLVVAGLIEEGGRVLVARRPPGGSFGGLWEFPGGKVEPGESPEAALSRELAEELGLAATVGEELVRNVQERGRELELRLYRVSAAHGEIVLRAHDAKLWADRETLSGLPMAPPDLPLLDAILPLLSGGSRPAPSPPRSSRRSRRRAGT